MARDDRRNNSARVCVYRLSSIVYPCNSGMRRNCARRLCRRKHARSTIGARRTRARRHACSGDFADTDPACHSEGRRLLSERRARRQSACQYRPDPGRGAARGGAASRQHAAVHRDGTNLYADDAARPIQGTRHCQLVWAALSRPENLLRRNLRHVRHDRGAYRVADSELCARDQSRQQQIDCRAHQRPRAVSFRPPDRPFIHRGLQARRAWWRQSDGRSGNHHRLLSSPRRSP